MKILIVGGTFDNKKNEDGTYGRPSGLVTKFADAVRGNNRVVENNDSVVLYNGGNYDFLTEILNDTPDYGIVFWFANVDNELPKIRDVKTVAPKTMLVTSKRNDNSKYTFQELVQRALASKSNLMFEFSRTSKLFMMRVFDPLGCQWYSGTDITDAVDTTLARLYYLKDITRQSTTPSEEDKSLMLKWYFDSFKQDMYQSDKTVPVPEEQEFINLVHTYAERFHELMNPGCEVKRFLGNCSMKRFLGDDPLRTLPPQVGRCSKGMPSFKHGNCVFVSQRNVDKEYLDISHFVPTWMDDGKVYYSGDKKPSVDTPIQLRLYDALPNIRYMVHSHCYIDGAEFTTKSIPCGAIEEVEEVLNFIDREYKSRELTSYHINLFGHGSIIMGSTPDELKDVNYIKRPMPETMTVHK